MLTSKNNWHKLNGYREFSYLSLHTDSLFVIQAATSGLKEKTFFHPVFHKEHIRRFDAQKDNEEQRRVYLEYNQFAKQMVKEKKALIFNDEHWGLNDIELSEIVC